MWKVYLGYENIRGIARGDSGVTPPSLQDNFYKPYNPGVENLQIRKINMP